MIWATSHKYIRIQVSDSGEVKLADCDRILSQRPWGNSGYKCVRIRINKKRIVVPVHKLVAEIYVPNPGNKPIVNHKDGNKFNNHSENLEWTTYSENLLHAYAFGLRKPNKKRNSGMFKKGSNSNPVFRKKSSERSEENVRI